ncbi:SANT and BTB domain regulator of class switch recombination-like [Watersipora subatra]|uniref:SANT and BTB domain regulator of class switch recombination-like n=1 Tax=Watersipora subatra TaxID=2589382 RepID=UPI00355C514E
MSVQYWENVALDSFLQQLVVNKKFDILQTKNWEAISNMFPGTTPYQCQKRYKEFKSESVSVPVPSSQKVTTFGKSSQREQISEPKGDKATKGSNDTKSTPPNSANSNSSERDQGPTMVIHVCDEAKNLKQDFYCPRDLLVREMKYFAEYLSADSQRWEDVDISVHCDVQIFDWLMKHVKRGTKEFPHEPKLETTNVISILISSDFLKMDNLIDKCIEYCHKHMNAILSTPCNMNCINDRLVTRITALFSHNEVEELKDRKDKFRSKLFAKKTEKLFETDVSRKINPDSPENASTLYRCKACGKLLTKTLEKKLSCISSRMLVDRYGSLLYVHERDASWDVSDFLIELKQELKTWRDVYWRLWGIINYLNCSRCGKPFQCYELAGCFYHKDVALYQSDVMLGKFNGAVGTYICCGQQVIKFDPTKENVGCQVKDHVIQLENADDGTCQGNKVYEDLLAYRNAITVEVSRPTPVSLPLNVFANDELMTGLREEGIGMFKSSTAVKQLSKLSAQPRLQPLTHEIYEEGGDFLNSEEEPVEGLAKEDRLMKLLRKTKTRVMVKSANILVDGPEFAGHSKNKWDASRSVRFNQDAQRQEDIIRQREMIHYLTRLRIGTDKLDKHKQREYAGGLFSRLEAQFRANMQAKSNNQAAPRSSRAKPYPVKSTF